MTLNTVAECKVLLILLNIIFDEICPQHSTIIMEIIEERLHNVIDTVYQNKLLAHKR